MEFRLFTLGGLRLEAGGEVASGAPAQRRRLALLALLAGAGDRGISREKAFGYLWPEHSASRARHLLSESMYVLRRFMGESAIVATQDDVRIDAAKVWSDVGAFRKALAAGDHAAAVALYAGPFLDGFFLNDAPEFDQWATHEAETLARELTRALESLAEQHAARNDVTAAAQHWQRLAAHEPYSSRIALRYMEALVAAGDRARALQHANAHAERVRADVGIEPDAAVPAYAQKLQRDAGDRPVVVKSASNGSGFGEFEIVRLLGEGSVAKVYLARESALRRMVAIKVLSPMHAAEERARLRFEREAQAAARIQHPNVLAAYRFGRTDDGVPYIVMPYVAGGSLEDRLAATGPLPLDEGKNVIAQLAGALDAAHRLGIVHRDVRPANVLYDRNVDRVLLADFGLAAVLEDGSDAILRLTRPGETLGDIAYASPEQIRGETVTERADMYSLGVVGFELLTGRLPFEITKPKDLLLAHTGEPVRLRQVLPNADEKLEGLLNRCLNKRPEQRPFAAQLLSISH